MLLLAASLGFARPPAAIPPVRPRGRPTTTALATSTRAVLAGGLGCGCCGMAAPADALATLTPRASELRRRATRSSTAALRAA